MSYEASVTIYQCHEKDGLYITYKPPGVELFVPHECLLDVTGAEWHSLVLAGPKAMQEFLSDFKSYEPYKTDSKKYFSLDTPLTNKIPQKKPLKPVLRLVDLGEGMLVPRAFIDEVIFGRVPAAQSNGYVAYPTMDDLKKHSVKQAAENSEYLKKLKEQYYNAQKQMDEMKTMMKQELLKNIAEHLNHQHMKFKEHSLL